MRYQDPFMNFVMTPPSREEAVVESPAVGMSSMRIVKENGLGEVQSEGGGGWNISITTVAISALVISAIAFMALCVVSMSKK